MQRLRPRPGWQSREWPLRRSGWVPQSNIILLALILRFLSSDKSQITPLLRAWSSGDNEAFERLTVLLYDELRRMARHYARPGAERPEDVLQPTELMNEAYLRLLDTRD